MTHELPAPLTPADCDLRDFPFMPLDVVRLRDSDLAGHENAEVFRTAVLSWCISWHQTPAGSLPDDDAKLARLFGFGRDLDGWKAVRHALGGLYGWVRCSDGRLYHPIVAEKVIEAIDKRTRNKTRTKAATEARLGKRDEHRNETRNEERNAPSDDARNENRDVPPRKEGRKERNEGTKEDSENPSARSATAARERVQFDRDADKVVQAFDQALVDVFGESHRRPNAATMDLVLARRWLDAGFTAQQLYDLFRSEQASLQARGKPHAGSLKFFEATVERAKAGSSPGAQVRFLSPDAELRARRDWWNREFEAAEARGEKLPDLKAYGLWYDAHNGQQIRLMSGERPPIPPAPPREGVA